MGFSIFGFSGNGPADVNEDHQLTTKSITESEIEFESDINGSAYSWASGTYDPDQDDTILLVKSTSATQQLHVEGFWISADTDTRVVIHLPTAEVTVTGTTVTGTNLNTGKPNVAAASAARDETGNTQGTIIWSGEVYAASGPYFVDFKGALILAENKSVGVDFTVAATAGDITMLGHFA